MLLYPAVETDLHLQYTLHGHRITVCTIDLAQDWRKIHAILCREWVNWVKGRNWFALVCYISRDCCLLW